MIHKGFFFITIMATFINHLIAYNKHFFALITWEYKTLPARICGTNFKPGVNVLNSYCKKRRLILLLFFKFLKELNTFSPRYEEK